ncbi:MAG: hypothetical protein IJQ02_12390 [Oscillospiraceae bacterium]|nr:hypothetical protein [Oscillospiraceae bacterium]
MFSVSVVLLSAALLLAMVVNLTQKPAKSAKLTTNCMLISVFGGLIYYGVGFAEKTGSLLLSVVRTPLTVTRMFVGVNELSAIEGTTLVSTMPGLLVFWLLHLLAFYSVASAAINTLGAEALRYLRFLLSEKGDLTLIYGINEDSLALAADCAGDRGSSVVFVAENATAAQVNDLNNRGMSVFSGRAAAESDSRFIRRLHLRRRKLTVYALHAEEDRNLFYALRLKDALEKAGVSPERTRITLPGAEDILTPMLQVSESAYGFGYVNVYDLGMLAARAMIRTCPPWDFVSFDAEGRAEEDFSCVLIGFGRYGQAALKQLVMNGQFAGSRFHAAVFSPKFRTESGYLLTDCPDLMKNYDITIYEEYAGSKAFYDYLEAHLSELKLIAVCTGNEETNREVSDSLMLYLKRRMAEHICVVRCGRSGARYQETVGSPVQTTGIFTRALLSAEDADREAILLNSIYDTSERSPWEKWVACDAFSKMSSRASADFVPALLKASGCTREELLSGDWKPEGKRLDALGETEHRRWLAFHYAMGYTRMSDEEFEANARLYALCMAEGKPCPVRVSKNQQTRTHACLIPWEELDALSAREKALTGREVNYRQMDINNVLALPQLLRSEEEAKKAG